MSLRAAWATEHVPVTNKEVRGLKEGKDGEKREMLAHKRKEGHSEGRGQTACPS